MTTQKTSTPIHVLTLEDYFAGLAMIGLLNKSGSYATKVKTAYEIGYKMVEEKKQRENGG